MVRYALFMLLFAAPLAAAAPVPQPVRELPGGVADGAGKLGLIAGPKGLELIDLADGHTRWTSQAARVPLGFVGNTAAALADDPQHANRATVVFLDLATGRPAGTSPALTFPAWASTRPMGGKGFRASTRVVGGELVLEWHASSSYWGGVAPPPTYKPSFASGRFQVSAKTVTAIGKVVDGDDLTAELPAVLASQHFANVFDGRAWSDRAQATGSGFVALKLSADAKTPDRQKLTLLRWDLAGKALPEVTLLSGRSLFPSVDPAAGTLIVLQGIPLEQQSAKERVVSVFSLATGARLAVAPYDQKTNEWRWVAPRLYGTVEGTQSPNGGVMQSTLTLVAMDASGKPGWKHALAPRVMLLPPP